MKNRFLFPHSYRRIGWLLFVPFLVFGLAVLNHDFQFDFLEISFEKSPSPGTFESIFSVNTINLSDEIATLGMILSLLFIAFSKEKIEDERVAQIRLDSLHFAVYLNYAVLAIQVIFVHGTAFLDVMVYNMFSVLLLFIIRYRVVFNLENKA
ncbi:MAG: hypothetical protein NT021_04615 [Sphingobacteriales bacterium]|nr:hypothetical protein [Sphingobacteriales bacterium]